MISIMYFAMEYTFEPIREWWNRLCCSIFARQTVKTPTDSTLDLKTPPDVALRCVESQSM